MQNDSSNNPRLAPALARGKRRGDASLRREVCPAPTCALDELPDFSHQVEAAQEQARARRSEQERRAEIDRVKLKSAHTVRPERQPTSVQQRPEHQGRPESHERQELTPDSSRAWTALVRHAAASTDAEGELADRRGECS